MCYALIQSGYAIFGIGDTIEEARRDAAEWLEGGADAAASAPVMKSPNGVHGVLMVVHCSRALHDTVIEKGGDIDYVVDGDRICLESELALEAEPAPASP